MAASHDAFRSLHVETIFVALTNVFANFVGLGFGYAESFERPLTKQQTGFECFAQLVFHALSAELQRMFPII